MRSPAARIARSTAKTLVVLATLLFAAAGTLRFWQAWGYLALNRENTHASSVIEVGAGQTVVSSGPYRFVRHPMYVAAIVMALATPLSLGSTWAMFTFAPCVALVALRLLDEERFLSGELPGYRQYMQKTRSRLLPGVW
jgi:protein-S-isoprenylcysteine O-methyltransferase Ste14